MQRDDSANLRDMNDNNDKNTDIADGGKMCDTIFLTTMLEVQSRGGHHIDKNGVEMIDALPLLKGVYND